MNVKKDKIFVLVMALITANLAYVLIRALTAITSGLWLNVYLWGLVIADVVAIVGSLWLLRSYKRGRKKARLVNHEDNLK